MPNNNTSQESQLSGSKIIKVEGHVQGLVIGDHNTVTQHFTVNKPQFPTPRESPRLAAKLHGREAEIAQISAAMNNAIENGVVVVCGMGGIGKSTLVSHVSMLPNIEAVFTDGCFWVDLQNGDIMEALARMAQAFGENVETYDNLGSRSRAVRSILHQKYVLIILDNAWIEQNVEPFRALGIHVVVLVTTRDEGLAYQLSEQVIHVSGLDHIDAINMLQQLSGQQVETEESQNIALLAKLLGGLPLALELVAKQVRKEARRPGFSWQSVRERLQQGEKRLGIGHGEITVRNAFEQSWQHNLKQNGQQCFAMLGIFPHNDMLSGEIAAAWDMLDDAALEQLNELLDLSLLLQIDEVTVRLHPLLKDFAQEKLNEIEKNLQLSAHQRVFDFHFQRAPNKPANMNDIQPVLSAHYHASLAIDKERAKKVFPWYKKDDGDGAQSIAVPGFLIDHGHRIALVQQFQLQLDLVKQDSLHESAWDEYYLGDALAKIGDNTLALEHLSKALSLSQNNENKEDYSSFERANFSYRIGQVCADMGDFDSAMSAFEVTLKIDRKNQQGQSALNTSLQIADVLLQRNGPNDLSGAINLISSTYELAASEHYVVEELMALVRLADLTSQQNPAQCANYVQAALALETHDSTNVLNQEASPFYGRQGARYASQLGKIAAQLALNGNADMLKAALKAYTFAVHYAGESGSWFEQSITFYWLGNLFEHLFLVQGFQVERIAAWACYDIASRTTKDMDFPPGINPAQRIETRILPQIEAQQMQQLQDSIANSATNIIQETVNRLLEITLWKDGTKTLC